jgi:hypothetical protein
MASLELEPTDGSGSTPADALACSGGGSGAAGIDGEHTTVARKRVMRERLGKVPLDRFSVSL